MDKSAAADLLGVPEHEVIDVQDSPDGEVIRTFDGVAWINTSEGVKYLVAPAPGYGAAFPVYRTPASAPSSWAAVNDREREVLEELGVDLADVDPRPGTAEALGITPGNTDPALRAGVAEQEGQVAQHVAQSGGKRAMSNPETGATNIADAADPTDPGTVVPVNGSEHEVLTWAGDDPARVQQALDAEKAKANPRARLVKRLADKTNV